MDNSKKIEVITGPLVWVDCEMTGLDPKRDKLLEIAVLITNGDLELVDDGINYVIRTEKEVLDGMGEWCQKTHGKSGLTEACLESPYTREFVKRQVLSYIQKWIPKQRHGVLAGNSVHMDRLFLLEEMPEVLDHLHYRIVDVSSFKEIAHRWYKTSPSKTSPPEPAHRALDDIKGSIRELKWYRQNLFMPPSLAPTIELHRRY